MTPVPDRFDFPYYAQKYFHQTGLAVEVGAWEGEYAKKALRVWKGEYVLIDTWAHREDDAKKVLNDKNLEKEEEWDEVMLKVRENTALYQNRVRLIKGYSIEAAKQFHDQSIDWVFIDAGHDYDNCMNDLCAWWPKVRPGGFFTGDDFGLSEDHQSMLPLTVKRWKDRFDGLAVAWRWGTANALEHFSQGLNLEVHVTYMNDNYPNIPAWYIIKPK